MQLPLLDSVTFVFWLDRPHHVLYKQLKLQERPA